MTDPAPTGAMPSFFEAALAGLQCGSPQPQALTKLADRDWKHLLAFTDLAHVTLPLVLPHRHLVPEWVRSRVDRNLADNRLRLLAINAAYREISDEFAKSGVEHLVLKGFAQFPGFVSSLDNRMQSDIDLYCPRASIPGAQQALRALGYRYDPALSKYPADHLPEMTRRGAWQWRGNHYDPEMPPAVDLHYCLWNELATAIPLRGLDGFWDRRLIRHDPGFALPVLAAPDNLAFAALHVLRDLLRGDWVLHHALEIATFLQAHADDESFWQDWRRLHDSQLRSMQAISFSLARVWFGCRLSLAVNEEIDRLPSPVRQWVDRFSQSPLQGMFSPNKHGLWLHMALLPSTQDKLRVMGKHLLPLRIPRPGAEAQMATKTRRQRRFWPSQRLARYGLHLIFRSGFHLSLIPGTLWRGLGWWFAQRRPRKRSTCAL